MEKSKVGLDRGQDARLEAVGDVGANVDEGDIKRICVHGLAGVDVPPAAKWFLAEVADKRLVLEFNLVIDSDAKINDSGHTEQCAALRWQLALGGDEGGHADELARVHNVEKALLGERCGVTGATDVVRDDRVNLG